MTEEIYKLLISIIGLLNLGLLSYQYLYENSVYTAIFDKGYRKELTFMNVFILIFFIIICISILGVTLYIFSKIF